MKSSMRLSSPSLNSAMSWKLAMWCSGMTSRWTGACGLMSRMATKPSIAATCSPSRYSVQKRQSSARENPLPGDGRAADGEELADRSVDEPGRVVVAVAAAGAVDEHDLLASHFGLPARSAGLGRERAQPRTAHALDLRRHPIVALGEGARTWRVREHVQLREARITRDAERVLEGAIVLGGEADDDVAREVEVVERREPSQIGRGRVATAHRAQHAVVAGLQRNVQMTAHGRRLAQGGDEVVVYVVDLDRRQSQPLEPWRRADLTDKSGKVEPGGAVAVA